MGKIYFCGSIRAGAQDRDLYQRIIQMLGKYGQVLTEHVGKPEATQDSDLLAQGLSPGTFAFDQAIFKQDVAWLKSADVVIAETTVPSLGVGFELGMAYQLHKPILCLYRVKDAQKGLSAMVRGFHDDDRHIVKDYEESQLPQIFQDFFAKLSD